jgi:thiamine biosynthesis lipoprotein
MPKMSTEPTRQALNGPTMGTRWQATFSTAPDFDPAPVQAALQGAVDEVDDQMSTWNPDSDLMRLNAAPVGDWVDVPDRLLTVLRLGLAIGKVAGGAFDIGMGDAVMAWGFGPEAAAPGRIRAALDAPRTPAHEALEIGAGKVRKLAPVALDLNGIAKGYGVDRLAEVLTAHGLTAALVGIDGEMRAMGLRPDAAPWSVAIEAPDPDRRAPHSILALEDAAVATSGDYRQRVDVGGRQLSHTMDPARGAPLVAPPASVTVVERRCAVADAWATALMVLGPERGVEVARRHRLDALFLVRDRQKGIVSIAAGDLFAPGP